MPNRKVKKELQTLEVFEKSLEEEISMTMDFDLSLSVLVVQRDDSWDEYSTRLALGALRVADLVTATTPEEIFIALPNTSTEDALIVAQRLREAVPEARLGITPHYTGDNAPDLLKRARDSAASA